MKPIKFVSLYLIISLCSGCASKLNSIQEKEYKAMQHSNALIMEKNPDTGAILGLLPGGGSFYAREPGLGILNLLLWPASILWDPISGYQGSQRINYEMTKYKLSQAMKAELSELDNAFMLGTIDNVEYVNQKKAIERKYTYD